MMLKTINNLYNKEILLLNIEKDKNKYCSYFNKIFDKYQYLKNHI